MSDNFMRLISVDCPICNKLHPVEERKRMAQAVIKDEAVDYEEVYFRCPQNELNDKEENEFVPLKMMDENLLAARDAYRVRKGLLTSQEIAGIRNMYGLSQSDFAALLGWGDITVTRYESKVIQDETYDKMMRMTRDNPMFALESLDKHTERFSADKFEKIRKSIIRKIDECGNYYLKRQEIESLYVNFAEESDYNGYKVLDIVKVSNIIGYFAHFISSLYKVKLMKLLWYSDALYFCRYGKSMTGLVYKHMPLGALPIAFEEIVSLPAVKIVEELICEDIAYRICSNKEVNISQFTIEELGVLEAVARKFMDYNTKQIIDYMHKEKAYEETVQNQIIPYSLARQLNELI